MLTSRDYESLGAKPIIRECMRHCFNQFQDLRYGNWNRVHNPTEKKVPWKGSMVKGYRCTVCTEMRGK